MAKIKISTTQNIDIEYEAASVGERIFAWMIDFFIQVAVFLLLALLVVQLGLGEAQWIFILLYLITFFYHLAMETLWHGQSIGKKTVRIKVVRLDGSHPTFSNFLLRWLFRIFECNLMMLYGGIAVCGIAMTPKSQRLGDVVAGTAVIKMYTNFSLFDTIFRKTNPDYKPNIPEVRLLTDRDVRTIQEVIKICRRQRNLELLNMCGNRVATQLGVTPKDMNVMQFLETVIYDYNHLN